MNKELLWRLLSEKFEGYEDLYGIKKKSKWGWGLTIRLYDNRDLTITSRDGEIEVRIDLELTHSEIEDMLRLYKYERKFKEATTEEEVKRIDDEMSNEKEMILDDFKRKMFEKYFDGCVGYLAKKYAWAEEIARRMGEKYGFKVSFEVQRSGKPGVKFLYAAFNGVFDSSNMDDEQIAHEALRAIDAVLESKNMFENEDMMKKFLISRGIEPSPAPKIARRRPKKVTLGIAGKLRDAILEKFKENPHVEEIEIQTLWPMEKWEINIYKKPQGICIIAYKDGRIYVGASKIPTGDEISDYLYTKKYKRKYEKAKTEEERKRIFEEEEKEIKRIIEDFKQERFEEYLKAKERDIVYYAKQHMWAHEIARRISRKYGFEAKFDVDVDSIFTTIFDSKGMSDEQVLNEVLKRVDAMVEADEMLANRDLMNEFLIGRGIEPWKPKTHKVI
ncbi:MAG: hypothetical protein FGF50_01810 [Candidatus Brockarchaeota archaeon]|nr:hypothetical protein [Candidatus Brockarchaeota archaeon]